MKKHRPLRQEITFVFVLLGAVIMTYPLLWMLGSSFKPVFCIFNDSASLWPSPFTLDNYIKGWKGISGITFSAFYLNSFVLVALTIAGNVVSCSLTAYAFARIEFTLKSLFFALMLGTLMLPHHVTLIPQYVFFYKLGWINTFLPLTVPKFFATDAFFIFLMVQFIRGLPLELDNAAKMDGCNHAQTFVRIIFPLLLPALVTTAIFTFIWTWNDFFSQAIYISDPHLFTVTLALRSFVDTSGGESLWGSLFAMSTLSLVPIFAFFVIFQRFLVDGIATSGIKG
ncbi:carbohydrate ABC transporter permease [Paenibacillus thalictri]|uniref:Carbohydrate ABC transporter permease n=1 Tax=Paenibacillus thalictri TaxID=2527873 RepID=A0A4Q9DY95_9BACL|nr:carbohydrate ABC transporter permease [Paenibacillus thalictri]TBL81070.1 carbohydrate ABC transporter permease [Paenibacillus thalictri]